MIKKIVFLALIAGFVYLNYTNPKEADHRAMLLEQLQIAGPVSTGLEEKIFKDVDFSNFMVCSVTKTIEDSKMISLGYMKKTRMLNDRWLNEIRKKYLANSIY